MVYSGLVEADEKLAEIAMKQARKAKDTEAQCSEFLSGKKCMRLKRHYLFRILKRQTAPVDQRLTAAGQIFQIGCLRKRYKDNE